MKQQPSSGFFDRNTLLAIAIVFGFWWAWQKYLAGKYPDAYKPKPAVPVVSKDVESSKEEVLAAQTTESVTLLEKQKENESVANEEVVQFENDRWVLEMSTRGLGFKKILLKNQTDREKNKISFSEDAGFYLFETRIHDSPVIFRITDKTGSFVKGTVLLSDGSEIEKVVQFNSAEFTGRYSFY